MRRRLNAVAIRAGVVRVFVGVIGFITDDGIPNAKLEVESIADGSPEVHIGLSDREIRARFPRGSAGQKVRVRPKPQIRFVASSPLRLIQGPFDSEPDHIEVEALLLAWVKCKAVNIG